MHDTSRRHVAFDSCRIGSQLVAPFRFTLQIFTLPPKRPLSPRTNGSIRRCRFVRYTYFVIHTLLFFSLFLPSTLIYLSHARALSILYSLSLSICLSIYLFFCLSVSIILGITCARVRAGITVHVRASLRLSSPLNLLYSALL